MSGLPGTGKDTYIKKNFPTLPVVSLDDIRERIGVSPTENQAPVVLEAHNEARALLRKRTPFVWNATSITADLRNKQISLFEEYGASVRCVWLETGWEEELRRNRERERNVPEAVIERMLSRLELPEAYECERVEWIAI
jgi:predicted kinase